MTAQEWYEQGNAFRKESKWHEAINCYIQAIALDPDSPAVEAKRMLDHSGCCHCRYHSVGDNHLQQWVCAEQTHQYGYRCA